MRHSSISLEEFLSPSKYSKQQQAKTVIFSSSSLSFFLSFLSLCDHCSLLFPLLLHPSSLCLFFPVSVCLLRSRFFSLLYLPACVPIEIQMKCAKRKRESKCTPISGRKRRDTQSTRNTFTESAVSEEGKKIKQLA